jgi:hypothetical protein
VRRVTTEDPGPESETGVTSRDPENAGTERATVSERRGGSRPRALTGWRSGSRWLVHLGLLATVAAAFGTLQLLHIRNAIHADVGLAFAGLVIVHLAQRRHRVARLVTQLGRARPLVVSELRLLASDSVLAFLAVNVVVSGIIDWGRGAPLTLPFPPPFGRWHLLSSIALVGYLVVHVSRRWRRIRRSTIR